MWLQLAQLVIIVHLDIFGVIYRKELEGVDDYEDAAHIGVDLLLFEATAQVAQQSLFVEIRQVTKVIEVLWQGLRQEAPLHHAPPLFCDLQPHLQVAVVDGAIKVLLSQQEAVVLTAEAVLQGHARPQHHALDGTVGRVEDPFFPAKLFHFCQDVAFRSI